MKQDEVYVGARYVPVFADPVEWSSDRTYEPLTIVTHNYNTYTSRQYVPTGIDIDDPVFWVMSGNTGGAIEDFTQQIEALQTALDDVESDVSTNTSAIGALQTNVGNNTSAINTNANAISALQTNVGALQTSVGNNTSAIGTLQTDVSTLNDLVAAISSTYDTVAAMLADYNAMSATDLAEKVGEVVRTACFVDMDNGGGAFYRLVQDTGSTYTANNMDVFALTVTGYFVVLVPDAVVSLEQFGVVSNATTGYAGTATHTAIAYVINNIKYKNIIGNGLYLVSQSISIDTQLKTIEINDIYLATAGTSITINQLKYCSITIKSLSKTISIYNAQQCTFNISTTLTSNQISIDRTVKGCIFNITGRYGTFYLSGYKSIFNLTTTDSSTIYLQQIVDSIINVPNATTFNLTGSNISNVNIYSPKISATAFRLTGNYTFYGKVMDTSNNLITNVLTIQNGKAYIDNPPIIIDGLSYDHEIDTISEFANYFETNNPDTSSQNITLSTALYGIDTCNTFYVNNTYQIMNVIYNNNVIFNGSTQTANIFKIILLPDSISIKQI